MGTWGTGYFENDTALDFIIDIEESKNPKATIEDTLNEIIEADFLDADQGSTAVVIAAYIDRQLNGTLFSEPGNSESLDIDTFPDRHPDVDLSDLCKKAILALKKVLGNDSELKELWAENEGSYPVWKQSIETLAARLEQK